MVRVGIPSQSPSLRTRPKHTPDRDKPAERQENELSMKFSETDDLETKTQQFFQFFPGSDWTAESESLLASTETLAPTPSPLLPRPSQIC